MQVSDRILVLDHGAVIAEGVPNEIASNQAVIDAYLGRVSDDAAA
jgi:ABC-type branched-subunit amino acid transport system ATPase component